MKKYMGFLATIVITLICSMPVSSQLVVCIDSDSQIQDIVFDNDRSLYVADEVGLKRYSIPSNLQYTWDFTSDFEYTRANIKKIAFACDLVSIAVEDYGVICFNFDDFYTGTNPYGTFFISDTATYGVDLVCPYMVIGSSQDGLIFYKNHPSGYQLDFQLSGSAFYATEVLYHPSEECVIAADSSSFFIVNYSYYVRDIIGEIIGFNYEINSMCAERIYIDFLSEFFVLLASETDGFHIFNVTDATNPFEIGSYPGSFSDVVFDDRFPTQNAVLASDEGIIILDISDPSNPVKIGECLTESNISQVAIDYDVAFGVTKSGQIVVYDVEDPANPFVVIGENPSNTRTWILIISLIVLGILAGSLYFIYMRKKSSVEISSSEPIIETTSEPQPKVTPKKEIRKRKTHPESYNCYYCGTPFEEESKVCSSCNNEMLLCNVCKLPVAHGDETGKCSFCETIGHLVHLLEWVKVNGKCPTCLREIPLEGIVPMNELPKK